MNLMGHKDGNDTGDEEEDGDTDLPLGTRCRLSPMTERAWVHKRVALHFFQCHETSESREGTAVILCT